MITVYGKQATAGELRKIPTPQLTDAGRRWKPIQHGHLVDTLEGAISDQGWRVKERRFALGRKDADLAGAFLIEGVPGVPVPKGQTLSLGFLHSNARRRALRLTVGSEVTVCNNGMCTGEVLMQRVHDHTCDLGDEVIAALGNYTEHAGQLAGMVAAMQTSPITNERASEVLMQAGRRRIVGWATLGRVDAEYRNPRFSDHGRGTQWALLNAFTYAARPNINPVEQMTAYNRFRELVMAN